MFGVSQGAHDFTQNHGLPVGGVLGKRVGHVAEQEAGRTQKGSHLLVTVTNTVHVFARVPVRLLEYASNYHHPILQLRFREAKAFPPRSHRLLTCKT